MMRRVAVIVLLSSATGLTGLTGCGKRTGKPTGSPGDPVTVCERLADVCRLDGNRLGVCAAAKSGSGFTCAAQH